MYSATGAHAAYKVVATWETAGAGVMYSTPGAGAVQTAGPVVIQKTLCVVAMYSTAGAGAVITPLALVQ